jgi:hypothetical protein
MGFFRQMDIFLEKSKSSKITIFKKQKVRKSKIKKN